MPTINYILHLKIDDSQNVIAIEISFPKFIDLIKLFFEEEEEEGKNKKVF